MPTHSHSRLHHQCDQFARLYHLSAIIEYVLIKQQKAPLISMHNTFLYNFVAIRYNAARILHVVAFSVDYAQKQQPFRCDYHHRDQQLHLIGI